MTDELLKLTPETLEEMQKQIMLFRVCGIDLDSVRELSQKKDALLRQVDELTRAVTELKLQMMSLTDSIGKINNDNKQVTYSRGHGLAEELNLNA